MVHSLGSRSAPIRALLIIGLMTVITCAPEKLVGTDLGAQPSPDFTLTDGRTGSAVSLSGLRGSVVALTFLYTTCPDTCPLTAEHFREAQQRLGADADRVRFVAVSVDPVGDTPAAVRDFSASHRLDRNWHYLIGPPDRLKAAWSAYGIRQESDPAGHGVGHTDAIYLIDAKGNARVLLHTVDGVDALTKDLRSLVRER
ncbi:MAG: SCO family protein [Chloroflexi bacterium]|nr:SCO family protein [Chloroflexota bacterium]